MSDLRDSSFREIVEQSLVGSLLVDGQKIVYANPCAAEIFGRPIEELIGLQLDQLIHPNDRRTGNERMRQRVVGTALSAPYSIRAVRPDGSVRELETHTRMAIIDGRQLVMISIVDATEHHRTQRVLNQIAEAVGSKIGEEFFSSLVLNLALTLETAFAFVAELCDDGEHLRMIAFAQDGKLIPGSTFPIQGRPCASVIGTSSLCWHASDVQRLYPDDPSLARLGIESYAGIPLNDSKGRGIGLLSMMHRSPMPHDRHAEAALEVYAARAASELERIRGERALVAATAYVDNLIETASVMIVELDTEGNVKRVNRRTEDITGYNREELLGASWFDLMMPPRRREHAATFLANLRNGRLLQINESPIVRRDGTERIIAWRNNEVRDADGHIIGSLSFGVDVTERIRVQEESARLQKALELVAEEWRGTFDAVHTPILITGRDGRMIRVNRAARQLLGMEEPQIVGHKVTAVRGEPWQTAARMIRSIANASFTTTTETRDELGRTWDITIANFSGEAGRSDRCILVFWNITGIVELQESLRRSETMSAMGTLVAGVAHEVRNPLFGISATLDAFAEELNQPGYQECAAALRGEVDRLKQVMQELLEYGKPSTAHALRTAFAPIVADALRHPSLHGTRVEVSVPQDLPELIADPDRLRQVIENLVHNAASFSGSEGCIRISACAVDHAGSRWIQCCIDDEGPGFAPEDLDRVFQPFFSRRQGGTGLGLSIVQRIIQDHSGRVFAENLPLRGARIRMLLPIAGSLAMAQ